MSMSNFMPKSMYCVQSSLPDAVKKKPKDDYSHIALTARSRE